MITLLLVDCGIEPVPQEIRSHPAVKAHSRRTGKDPGYLILDTRYHRAAMQSLPDGDRRGRPDIVHFCLLNALKTPLNRQHGLLQIVLHLPRPSPRIVKVSSSMRVPPTLNRFVGLMEQVLAGHENPFLEVVEKGLGEYITEIKEAGGASIHAFSRKGTTGSFPRFLESWSVKQDLVLAVGGFQRGDLPGELLELLPPGNLHSLAEQGLDAWTVVARLVHLLEMRLEKAHLVHGSD